ncbi:g6329 [Coccomyxa elongata]
MRALNSAIASLRRHNNLQARTSYNSQRIAHQGGQGDRLLKGIAVERQKGYQNISGKMTTFGIFLVEELQGLTGCVNGHHRRTLTKLIEEGEGYEAMNCRERELHLRRVESVLGSLKWESEHVQNAPLRSRTSHVLRMQHPLATGGESGNSLVQRVKTSGSADANGQPLGHIEERVRLDRDSMAEGYQQTAGISESSGVNQITYKGIVFDLETTGFLNKKSHILEIAALELSSREGMQTLVNIFPNKVPNSDVHGITTEMVHDASLPTSREAVQQFMDFINHHCPTKDIVPVLIAHNGRTFDIPFLAMEFARGGMQIPANWYFMDTLLVARRVINQDNIQSLKLSNLREHFGIAPPAVEHRAWQDVEVLSEVVQHLLCAGAAPDLQQYMQESLKAGQNGSSAPHAGPILELLSSRQSASKRTAMAKESQIMADVQRAADAHVTLDDSLAEFEVRRRMVSRLPAPAEPIDSAAAGGGSDVHALLQAPLSSHRKGFTDKQCKDLVKSGFESLGDLLFFFPRSYISYGNVLRDDAYVHLDGVVTKSSAKTFRNMVFIEVTAMVEAAAVIPSSVGLQNGSVTAHGSSIEEEGHWVDRGNGTASTSGRSVAESIVHGQHMVWGKKVVNSPFGWKMVQKFNSSFGPGSPVTVLGRVARANNRWELDGTAEFLEPTARKAAGTGGLVPVYSQRSPLKKGDIPKLMTKALAILEAAVGAEDVDILPESLCQEYNLVPWLQALRSRHQPETEDEAESARRRLAFEELLVLQLRLLLQRNDIQASALGTEGVCVTELGLLEAAREALPFQLTGGQELALENILRDMQGPLPMMCLLQGDVGCGKTAVAFLALLATAGSGYQAAMMLPTEILASQTHIKLQQLLQSMPEGLQPKLELLTGSTKAKERREIMAGLADGSIDLVVGTHALISDSIVFQNLGFAVVDEQHRFGVEQRARLAAKAVPAPHVMYMTATPIPRTLALVEHGDLALYTINELPPGRSPVATRALTDSPASRALVYDAIKEELATGGRAYIICPLVGDSASKGLADLKAAEEEHRRLEEGGVLGPGVAYGLLHGRLSAEEKADALAAFAAGRTNVLIATTVVEVGVDVPEASVIVVEGAERFGLAALHQLRGRVGRGARPSRCFLITKEDSPRLAILESSHSGFSIAEADLAHRGPGDFLGKRQSGRDAFSLLRSAKLPADKDLLDEARLCAAKLIADWQEGRTEPPPALLAAVRRQASMLLDISPRPASPAADST